MPQCDRCGNEYPRAFTVTLHTGETHTFDSFECAIAVAAPRCEHCGVPIIGHGLEDQGRYFCCAHCQRLSEDH